MDLKLGAKVQKKLHMCKKNCNFAAELIYHEDTFILKDN